MTFVTWEARNNLKQHIEPGICKSLCLSKGLNDYSWKYSISFKSFDNQSWSIMELISLSGTCYCPRSSRVSNILLFCMTHEVPLIGLPFRKVIVERYCSWNEMRRWNMTHKGRVPFHPACLLSSCSPPDRWQANRRITLPPPVISPVVLSFVRAYKRGP